MRKPNKTTLKKKMNIDVKELKKVDTIEDLVSKPPFMFLSKVIVPACSVGGGGNPVKLVKGDVIAMPLGSYFTASRSKDRNKLMKPYKKPFSDVFVRYRGQNLDGKKLLIWRGGGFGDLLFLQPIMKHIKKTWPTCKITVACFNKFADILSSFPEGLIDYITPVPVALKVLEFNDYHLAVEGVIERCKEAEKRVCYDLMADIAGFNIDFTSDDYRLELKPDRKLVREFSQRVPGNFVIVQMRASSPIRMMSDEKWARIIKRLINMGKQVAFVDRPENEQLYYDFKHKFELNTGVFNLTRYCKNINHAIAMTSLSDGIMGVDSAFTHIGEALNKPVLGIYGAFLGELRMKYYRNADWVQSRSNCSKMPCFWHHEQKFACKSIISGRLPECMEEIDEDEVMDKAKKLFK